jgi:hypothetical protein
VSSSSGGPAETFFVRGRIAQVVIDRFPGATYSRSYLTSADTLSSIGVNLPALVLRELTLPTHRKLQNEVSFRCFVVYQSVPDL